MTMTIPIYQGMSLDLRMARHPDGNQLE